MSEQFYVISNALRLKDMLGRAGTCERRASDGEAPGCPCGSPRHPSTILLVFLVDKLDFTTMKTPLMSCSQRLHLDYVLKTHLIGGG